MGNIWPEVGGETGPENKDRVVFSYFWLARLNFLYYTDVALCNPHNELLQTIAEKPSKGGMSLLLNAETGSERWRDLSKVTQYRVGTWNQAVCEFIAPTTLVSHPLKKIGSKRPS